VSELHIGHSIVSRSVYLGMRQAVAEMKAAIAASGEVIEGGEGHEH
jgi:pyridoxine 5'-phosphate synthase PdxJ